MKKRVKINKNISKNIKIINFISIMIIVLGILLVLNYFNNKKPTLSPVGDYLPQTGLWQLNKNTFAYTQYLGGQIPSNSHGIIGLYYVPGVDCTNIDTDDGIDQGDYGKIDLSIPLNLPSGYAYADDECASNTEIIEWACAGDDEDVSNSIYSQSSGMINPNEALVKIKKGCGAGNICYKETCVGLPKIQDTGDKIPLSVVDYSMENFIYINVFGENLNLFEEGFDILVDGEKNPNYVSLEIDKGGASMKIKIQKNYPGFESKFPEKDYSIGYKYNKNTLEGANDLKIFDKNGNVISSAKNFIVPKHNIEIVPKGSSPGITGNPILDEWRDGILHRLIFTYIDFILDQKVCENLVEFGISPVSEPGYNCDDPSNPIVVKHKRTTYSYARSPFGPGPIACYKSEEVYNTLKRDCHRVHIESARKTESYPEDKWTKSTVTREARDSSTEELIDRIIYIIYTIQLNPPKEVKQNGKNDWGDCHYKAWAVGNTPETFLTVRASDNQPYEKLYKSESHTSYPVLKKNLFSNGWGWTIIGKDNIDVIHENEEKRNNLCHEVYSKTFSETKSTKWKFLGVSIPFTKDNLDYFENIQKREYFGTCAETGYLGGTVKKIEARTIEKEIVDDIVVKNVNTGWTGKTGKIVSITSVPNTPLVTCEIAYTYF